MRICSDCGCDSRGDRFPGTRKPSLRPDRCEDCARDPFPLQMRRVEQRRLEIRDLRTAAKKAGHRFRHAKPAWTAPLFAGLRG